MTTARLTPGDPAPWFIARSPNNPRYQFDTVAGRYIAVCFFGSAGDPAIARMLDALRQRSDVFNDDHASFFAIGADPADEQEKRLEEHFPGFRLLWDFGLRIAARYGVCDEPATGKARRYQPTTFLLDPALRVLAASLCLLPQRIGGAYCSPPLFQRSLRPRARPSGVFCPTLRSKLSP